VAFYVSVYLLAHALYDPACCEDKHCHPVACEEISSTTNGWLWHGKLFARAMLRDSPDGNCHVCVAAAPVCIYLPPRV
jgi:hypothetical protein